MKRTGALLVNAAAVAVIAIACVWTIHALQRPKQAHTLFVHCGTSMRPAAEELAREYQRRYGTAVEFNFGGAEVLFPAIVAGQEGDVFICHDPFGDKLQERGLLTDLRPVGFLAPTIIVAKGNPKAIAGLDDLVKPGLRVGVTDPRYTTCGEMVQQRLAEKGLAASFTDHNNFVVQVRNHADLANALLAGQLDAGVVWNFIGKQFEDKLDQVPTGESFPGTRVTVCQLSCAREPEAARRFLELASSDEGKAIFQRMGYHQ